jgi:hypothetical protein
MSQEPDPNSRQSAYSVTGSRSVAVLAQVRQQAFSGVAGQPRYIPLTRPEAIQPGWLERVFDGLAKQAAVAGGIAALVLIVALALPIWSALRGGEGAAATSSVSVRSSAGVTGTTATRVEDLSATTFVGGVPFVQRLRYFDAVTGASSPSRLFVAGGREASLAEYLRDVGNQVALPYLNDAVNTRDRIELYAAAVEENERAARAQLAAVVPAPITAWQAPSAASGTRLNSTVTFYACVGNGFCGNMANGQQAYAGAAACSTNLPFGTRFTIADDPSGRVFTCLDRGALSSTWVDVWFYDAADGWAWQSIVGTNSDIIIK